TLEIQAPKTVTRTSRGDIIMDDDHKNKLYLRGLLLPHGSAALKPLHFGYNFLEGENGRDRESLGSGLDEVRRINKIWATAIRADKGKHLPKYTELI
ncbi:hypothetical protein BCR34DRAFT_440739, partial [Clohesyomyces aquaticus]